jgi:hypothetical protein
MKSLFTHVAFALVVLGFGTWAALEWSGVAIVTTRPAEGGERRTHVWFVESEGELWFEAGAPENPWFVDVKENPRISVEGSGIGGEYTAEVVPGRPAARRVRELLQEKYGLRDLWVGIFVDSASSTAVRLHSLPQRLRHGGSQRIQEGVQAASPRE